MIDAFVVRRLLLTLSSYYVNYCSHHKRLVMDVIEAMRERGFIHVKRCRTTGSPTEMGFLPLERGAYEMGQKALLLCLERMAADPVSQTTGMTFIVDSEGFTLDKLFYCNLRLTRRFLEYLQDCMPMKLKALHFVHESRAIDVLYGLFRPFLKRKLTERLHFHGENHESLLKEMPPNTLPKEYGGEADAIDFEGFWRQLEEEETLFVENNTFGYVDGNAAYGVPPR